MWTMDRMSFLGTRYSSHFETMPPKTSSAGAEHSVQPHLHVLKEPSPNLVFDQDSSTSGHSQLKMDHNQNYTA
jgi:hypothetical protein